MSRKLTFMSHAFCLKIDNVLSNVSWVGFWLTYQLVASTFSLRLLKRALPRPVLIGSTPQASRVKRTSAKSHLLILERAKERPPRGVPSWNLGRSVRVDNHDLSERHPQGQTRRQVLHIVDHPRRHCARYRRLQPSHSQARETTPTATCPK